MPRKSPKNKEVLDAPFLERIHEIKSDHPLWGYRRIWAYIRYRDKKVIGKNRVYRLMKENNLLVNKNTKLKAKRCFNRPKPRADKPNQYWGIDMTKVKIDGWGWVYIHIVLDWFTKEVIGHHFSLTSKSEDWEQSLHMAINNRFPDGILEKENQPNLISDNGCQPTSTRFMKLCSEVNIKQIFTTWNNPQGNADTERFFRTMKEDLVWVNEWNSPFDFQVNFEDWIHQYNHDFPHQSLSYKTPDQTMENYQRKEVSQPQYA